jgi:hypothetical protein
MLPNQNPRDQLLQLIADVKHRYDGDDVIHDVMKNALTGCITWGSSSVETLQNIALAIWDAADDEIRRLIVDGIEHEHAEICACCRARVESELEQRRAEFSRQAVQ